MKKTVDITIQSKRFHLEEDAYEKLKAYLDALAVHFAKQVDGKEIIDDIESAIGGHLAEITATQEVITLAQTEALIAQMGSLQDLAKDEVIDEAVATSTPVAAKKLYRDTDKQVIAGVSAGLAAYTGIPSWLIRAVFVVSVFFGGAGIVLYLILWLVMPEAKLAYDKMQMRGEPLTLATIESSVKSAFADPQSGTKPTSTIESLILLPFSLLGMFLRAVLDVLSRLAKYLRPALGVVLAACSAIGIGVVVILGTIGFFRFDRLALDRQSAELVSYLNTELIAILLIVLALIPLILCGVLAASILRRKNEFRIVPTVALVGIWLATITGLSIMAIDFVPHVEAMREEEMREYPAVTREVDVTDFSALMIDVPANVQIIQGDDWNLTLSGDERALQEVETIRNGEVLSLTWTPVARDCFWFCYSREIEATITMPTLTGLDLSHRATVEVAAFTADEVNVSLDGSSMVTFADLTANNLRLDISNLAVANLAGEVAEATLNLEHQAYVNGSEMVMKSAEVSIQHSSEAVLQVTDMLAGEVGMAGELIYEGSPDVSKLVEDNEYEDFDSDFERPSRIQRLDDSETTPDETE